MPSPNNDKNKEYQAKHRKSTREQMGEEAYKKMESEARKLRRQKAKAKAQPQIDMNALANFTSLRPLDIVMSTPPGAVWNGMAAWCCVLPMSLCWAYLTFTCRYSSTLAASNVPLAHVLLLHLGDLTQENFVLLETHNGDGRVAELIIKSHPSIKYVGCDFSSEMNILCEKRIKTLTSTHIPKV